MIPSEYAAKTKFEHGHQVALFMWAAQHVGKDPNLALLFSIPNGGERNKAVASRLKAEGVKPGVPDVMLPVAKELPAVSGPPMHQHGLFIEMKLPGRHKRKNGDRSDSQIVWHELLDNQGYYVATCYGYEEARLCVCWWLNLDPKVVK